MTIMTYILITLQEEIYLINIQIDCKRIECQQIIYKVRTSFSKEEAAAIALLLGIDFKKSKFDLDEFWMGVNTELEHGKQIQPNECYWR